MQVTKGVKHAVILPWGDAYEPQWSAQQLSLKVQSRHLYLGGNQQLPSWAEVLFNRRELLSDTVYLAKNTHPVRS